MRFFKTTNIDFLGKRFFTYIISSFLVLSSIFLILIKGLKYGIDFTGGTIVQLKFQKIIAPEKIRNEVIKIGIKSVEIQKYGSEKEYLIKYSEKVDPDSVIKVFKKNLDYNVILERTENVGPRIGKELQYKALEAVFIGMVLMLVYIALRFNLKFGIAAVIALFHDVIITLGMMVLLGREITIPLIAAFLTIVGYSINDSIIVSDRIRENLKKIKGSFFEIANKSINQTLSRTIITSGTTLFVVISLLLLGGPVLRDFSLALFIGIIVGTYSSIFIVAALVCDWERKKKRG
ncbi:MAG: protein translocase subunit SecF [candidate division WOR-3 bacterium]